MARLPGGSSWFSTTHPLLRQGLLPRFTKVPAHVPALDGVRAVAVAAVLAFHGGLPWVTGGFLGVDAFFVLSGYLITALLLAEWTRSGGRIDLVAFWGRRARRLLPALLLMVTAVAIGARALLPPEEVRLLRGDGIAALFYVANWRMIFRGGDYFAQTAAPSPLEHTWSLGIEEQFYLVWPLVLGAVLWPRGAPLRWLVVVCGVGTVASTVALAVAYSAEDPGRAYYGTDTRGAAILVGAGLAALLALRSGEDATPRRPPGWRRVGLGGVAAAAAVAAAWAATHLSGTDEVLYRGGMAAWRWPGGGHRSRGPRPVGVVGPVALAVPAAGAGADLVRRLPVALAGVHRSQCRSHRTGRPGPVHGALPPHRGHCRPLLRACRTPDPAAHEARATSARRDGRRGRGRGRRRGAGGDDRGASTAVAAGGRVCRHRGGSIPGGRR